MRHHDRDDAVQVAKAQHVERICTVVVVDNAFVDEDPVSGEEDEQREQARRLCERGGTKMCGEGGAGPRVDTECG